MCWFCNKKGLTQIEWRSRLETKETSNMEKQEKRLSQNSTTTKSCLNPTTIQNGLFLDLNLLFVAESGYITWDLKFIKQPGGTVNVNELLIVMDVKVLGHLELLENQSEKKWFIDWLLFGICVLVLE
jgi:hypothetical protein